VPLALLSCFASEPPSAQPLPLDQVPVEQLRSMLKGYPGDWRDDTDQRRGLPAPPPGKPVPGDAARIGLVAPDACGVDSVAFVDAVAGRRSCRSFAEAALTLKELSFLAWCTQGVTKVERNENGQAVGRYRTAPSGGARYPLETYLLVNRVEGVRPGVYRYLPGDHELVTVRPDAEVAAGARAACYGQPFVRDAAVVFVWAAVPYRTEWKYAYLAPRMIAMEAGHACQNLCLGAEAIGAGACPMLGYDQASMDALLGVDGSEEFTVYLACVGRRAGDAP
jgi:SagB-type dehydrogenase family enzyme